MQGFIRTDLVRTSLVNIRNIQCIEHYRGCIHAVMDDGADYTIFAAANDFQISEEFLNRMIDRIFFVLSDCEYDNVFIDIEVIKNDITKELKAERIARGE